MFSKRFLNDAIKACFVRKLTTLRWASDSHRKVYNYRNFYLNITMQFFSAGNFVLIRTFLRKLEGIKANKETTKIIKIFRIEKICLKIFNTYSEISSKHAQINWTKSLDIKRKISS